LLRLNCGVFVDQPNCGIIKFDSRKGCGLRSMLKDYGLGGMIRASRRCAIGRVGVTAFAVLSLSLFEGCTTQSVSGPEDIRTGRPVTIAPPSDTASSPDVEIGEIDQAELRKAIERYRITLDREKSPVKTVGVDLSGDARAEALVLFTGHDWCTTTGCSFVVFQNSERGYRPVSRTTRVRGPIKIGPGSTAGWRDLIVKTGGGAAPIRFVRLGFTGDGYPKNALLQPGPTEEVLAMATEVIPEVSFKAHKS